MGSLVRSEKARQSCTKFLHQGLAASSGAMSGRARRRISRGARQRRLTMRFLLCNAEGRL